MVMRKTQKDVGNFESKLVGPFTARQFIFIGIGTALDVLIYMFLSALNMDINSIIPFCFFAMVPFIALAYIKPYGMKFEEFVYEYYIYHIVAPPVRRYETHTALDDYKENLSPKEKKEREKFEKKMKTHKECKEYPSYL